MGLDTDFNQDPYFDDYSEDKGFHRILFKPGVAVQARELTQLQTILQTQIERFGDNILKEGTIVKGCSFGYIDRQPYVQIRDLQQDGQPVVMANYEGLRAVGLTSGVEAYVVKVSSGLESQYATTGTNTLHVRYVKSNGANTTFSTTEYIRLDDYRTGATETTVEVAGNVVGIGDTAIGNGTALRVSEGIIYQKGAFIAVDKQLAIVSRYSVVPDDLAAGFVVNETIINSNNDTTLLDNAAGYNNENAPGADRIQLSPILTVKSVANAIADEDFFTLVEYQNGLPIRRKQTTQYSVIGEEFARRTAEESGDYVIRNFPLNISDPANTSNDILFTRIGPGLAYVDGKRVETFGPIDIAFNESTTTKSVDNQNVTTNLGNYIIVDDFKGDIPFNEFATIDLYDGVQQARSADADMTSFSANGNFIGTAKVRSVEHHEGTIGTATAKYKLYLFDINVSNTSHTFADTRGVVYDGAGVDGAADIVTERGRAVLKDESFKTTLWDIGRPAIQTLDNADFVYRTVTEGSTISSGGSTVSFALGGSDTWTYGASATLNSTQKNEIILVANNSDIGPTNYYEGRHIDLTNATVTTSADAQTLTISGLSTATGTGVDVKAYHNIKKSTTTGNPKGKDLDTYYVAVDISTAPDGIGGTYCLGLPDVYMVDAVYYNSSGAANTSSTDVTSYFRLYRNQRDAYYGLSYVRKSNLLSLDSAGGLLFKIRAFTENTTQGVGFFSVDSYGASFTSNLNLENIPVYTSERGEVYDLRNSIDFRPYAANTVIYATTEGTAPTCTTSVTASPTFASGEKYTPAPNQNMEIDYSYYLGRVDKIHLDREGNFQLVEGTPAENPVAPQDPAKGLVLATIQVPPYPSLTPILANARLKPFHATRIRLAGVSRGYTMADIGKLDRRVKQLEYYTVLNSLETEAKDKGILDSSGNNRFKNGIFSDSFEDLSFSKVQDLDFGASVDPAYKEMQPLIDQYEMDLQVSATSNVTEYDEGALLSMTDVAFMKQPYATKGRATAEDELTYVGKMTLYPSYDPGYDVITSPDFNIDVDLVKPFSDFTTALNKFVPISSVQKSTASVTSTNNNAIQNNVRGTLSTTTSTTTKIVKELQVKKDSETDQKVGDFVTDIRFNPFMRSREISISITGVRPSTRLYFFFDDLTIDNEVAPAVGSSSDPFNPKFFRRSRAFGTAVTSDSKGRAKAIFRIPSQKYFVGTRKIQVFDISDLANFKADAKTSAVAEYNAFNYSVQKQGLNVATRAPKIDVRSITSSSVSTSSTFTPNYVYDAIESESQEDSSMSINDDPSVDAVGNPGPKIICTMMNEMYGFGQFRNNIWMQYQKSYMPREEYELGYHKLMMPFVKRMPTNKTIRVTLEKLAKRRTSYLRREMRGQDIPTTYKIARTLLRPVVFSVGWLVKKKILSKVRV